MAEQKSEKRYRVPFQKDADGKETGVSKTVGPWKSGDVFGESSFAKIHPIPKDAAGFDVESHHAELIQRLVTIEAIEPTKEEETLLRPGPHTSGNQVASDLIRQSTNEAISAQKSHDSIRKQDAAQVNAG